jgi:hypothetical protein
MQHASRSPARMLKALRWGARDRWGGHASYLALARRRHPATAFGADTRLVIEGFPRTANTFTVFAFQMAQPQPVRLAHHMHAPIQIIAAARRGVPVLALIRPPEDAVLSLVTWAPYVRMERALRAYSRFYERILPHRDRCVVAELADVTTDLGRVIDSINARYGTRFARFDHTPENVQACYRLIEEKSRRPPWADAVNRYVSGTITAEQLAAARDAAGGNGGAVAVSEARVARPSADRDAQRALIRGGYHDPRLARLRKRAERAYRAFTNATAPSA